MSNVNKIIREVSTDAEGVYLAQNKAFSSIEYRFLKRLISENKVRTVLDVGTGEGSYISGIASQTPGVDYVAIDCDENLIEIAIEQQATCNISYRCEEFGPSSPRRKFDLILARFAAEHMKEVRLFISESYKRLRHDGLLLLTEWYVDDLHTTNDQWKLFREKELELYQSTGSHPRLPLQLPKMLRDCGFHKVSSNYRQISPATVGAECFYSLIIAYTKLYGRIKPEIFSNNVKETIIAYSSSALFDPPERDDIILINHTLGTRP